MTSWAIVAIPSRDTPVWQMSSEKVPHLTLLFLGEQDSEDDSKSLAMLRHLQHVAETSLKRFGLGVDRRGTLGPEDADVIFFNPKSHKVDDLRDVRTYLLQDPTIAAAHASAEQYPEWIPHLTLGYPATPAHEFEDGFGISWVYFDKIALWTEDFGGYEIILDENSGDEIAMSESVEDFLAHHGVKGMKWGKRKKRRSSDEVQKDDRRQAVSKRRTLADHDIDKRIARLEKERKLKTLTEESQDVGKNRIKQIIANSGSKAAGVVLTGALIYGVKAAMERSFNVNAAASYMTPKPKK